MKSLAYQRETDFERETGENEIDHEIRLMAKLDNEHIVKYYGHFFEKQHDPKMNILIELCQVNILHLFFRLKTIFVFFIFADKTLSLMENYILK